MATKLSIYNGACALLGETPLASLSEDRSVRYWLDRAWDDGVIDACLEQGKWGFATRSQKITQSTTIEPAFGPQYAFELPNDFKGLNGIWSDENFLNSIDNYYIEAGIIYCDWNTIYIKYISNSATYGGNLARWPVSFSNYVEAYLANKAQPNVTNSSLKEGEISAKERDFLFKAKNFDKKSKPRQRMQAGNWVTSRTGYGSNYSGSGYYGANGF